jgi:hypothetical protein
LTRVFVVLRFTCSGVKRNMLKKLSIITTSVVAFAFTLVTIAHACSGLGPMSTTAHLSRTNMDASDSSPCGHEKSDVCQSVRDSMLSVKPSARGIASLEKAYLALATSIVSPSAFGSSPVALVTKVTFHPVFKLPLSFLYLVLRI